MNKKGLTLVELLAVLVLLSIVALIITPNIYKSIRDYRDSLYDVNVKSIEDACKNWAADHVAEPTFPNSDGEAILVTLGTLQDGGYIDDPLADTRNGGNFSKYSFVVISYSETEKTTTEESTYIYDYHFYLGINDYIFYGASLWADENIDVSSVMVGNSSTSTITIADLINSKYISSSIVNPETNIALATTKKIFITCTAIDENGVTSYEYTYNFE
ncbi:MAG: prepilin-type N-terminal cleavage/methylation domain-containing protein [Bacilli bacterium]